VEALRNLFHFRGIAEFPGDENVLSSLKTIGATYLPRAFALASGLADWRIARDPASEVNLLPLLVSPGDHVCDIGANRGLYIFWLLRLGAKVAGFEPNPHMVAVLRHRFAAALKEGRLELFDCALSDGAGAVTLHIPRGYSPLATIDGGLAGASGLAMDEVQVPRRRLDDCVGADIAFIKLDVEGHEQKVLDGASRLIAAARPSILVEAEERHRAGAVASLRQCLEPLGYDGFFVLADGVHPIAEFDPARHQRREALNGDGTGALAPFTYINNFVFTARPDQQARLRSWKPQRMLTRF